MNVTIYNMNVNAALYENHESPRGCEYNHAVKAFSREKPKKQKDRTLD
jgi:hypothetical protein